MDNSKIHEYPLPEWPKEPTDKAVGELVELFELACLANENSDPVEKARHLGLTQFLLAQNMSDRQLLDYHEAIKKVVEDKYPQDEQLQFDLN